MNYKKIIAWYIINIICIIFIMDIIGYVAWSVSGQEIPSNIYIGRITNLILRYE